MISSCLAPEILSTFLLWTGLVPHSTGRLEDAGLIPPTPAVRLSGVGGVEGAKLERCLHFLSCSMTFSLRNFFHTEVEMTMAVKVLLFPGRSIRTRYWMKAKGNTAGSTLRAGSQLKRSHGVRRAQHISEEVTAAEV